MVYGPHSLTATFCINGMGLSLYNYNEDRSSTIVDRFGVCVSMRPIESPRGQRYPVKPLQLLFWRIR